MTDSDRSILYIGTLVTDEIESEYGLSYYSRAANNKKYNMIESLQSVGSDVTVVSPVFVNENSFRYFSGRVYEDEELGVEVHSPPTVDIYGLNYVFLALMTTLWTIRLLLSKEFDGSIYYDFTTDTAIPATVGKLVSGTPTILQYDDGLFLHDNNVIRWSAKLLRPLCGYAADGAVCVNEPLADKVPTDNTAIVRGFPSIGMPEELPEQSDENDGVTVMFAGRFDRVRGIDPFLDVAPDVLADTDDVECWISGYGPDDEIERVETQVQQLDVDGIEFFGTLPWEEYRQRIVDADVLVNFQDPDAPISRYTFPSKLLDFLSAATPVVSTDMSDLSEHFDDKLLIAGTRHEELVEGVRSAVDRTRGGEKLSVAERGREWVDDECTHEAVGNKLFELIERAD